MMVYKCSSLLAEEANPEPRFLTVVLQSSGPACCKYVNIAGRMLASTLQGASEPRARRPFGDNLGKTKIWTFQYKEYLMEKIGNELVYRLMVIATALYFSSVFP